MGALRAARRREHQELRLLREELLRMERHVAALVARIERLMARDRRNRDARDARDARERGETTDGFPGS